MLATIVDGPSATHLEDVPMPTLAEGEVLVKQQVFGICGSDVWSYQVGKPSRPGGVSLPGSPGHECVGEVVETRGATRLKVGDRVLALPPKGNGFAEYLAVGEPHCVAIPDGLSYEKAIVGQQLGTVVHALRPAGSLLDKSVAIVGQGPAGLLFLTMGLAMGARRIVTAENRPPRQELSQELGAHRVLGSAEIEAGAATDEVFDLVIDAAGGQSAVDLSYQLVKPFGAVLQFGLPHGAVAFDHEHAFRKQVTTHRAVFAQFEERLACFDLAMELLRRGTVEPDVLVTDRFPFTQLPEALALAANPHSGVGKVLVDVRLAARAGSGRATTGAAAG